MKTEPLYIVKVHIPKFFDFSSHSIEYFMTKKQTKEKFQKEKEKLLEKFSEHLKYIDIKDTGNEFKMFNGEVNQYVEISLIETEVNI